MVRWGGYMRFPVFASIRASLVFLVLLALLPALGIMLFTGYTLRQSVIRNTENAALRQVQAMAAHHERVVDNARLLLATMAKAGEVQRLDALACQVLLEDMRSREAAYVALALADEHGRIVATSPSNAFTSIEHEKYFQDAMQDMHFTMGDYHLQSETHRVVIEFAQPVEGQDGRPRGVLVASFDLNYFGRIFDDARLPEGSVFTLTDCVGIRLTRFPETQKYTWVPDLPQMIARMSVPEEEGTFLEKGVDGVHRLYSFKRVHFADAPFPYLMIRLGQPVDLALAEARGVVLRNMFLLFLAAVLAVGTAWLVGEFTIMRRLNLLMQATDRLGSGDLASRTGLTYDEGELGRLAAAFDRMGEGLQRQDRERRQAEDEVRRLNEELEERVVQRTQELAEANADLHTALTDLKKAQAQLVMSEKLAALGELVAGVAHEINTPVGVALSATSAMADRNRTIRDLFEKGEMKRSDLTEYLESSREGAEMTMLNLNRASDLIRSFKMVAADQVSENRRAFNIRDYVGEILLSLRPKLKKTSHKVEVDCDENLVVESYPGAFSQILTNFIVNSLVHAFEEGQAGLIRIRIAREGDTLHLLYSDNGKGIAPELQNRIFEPFYTTARSKGSTGLGLHIVFNIVTRTLGGTITCSSVPGQGTTFEMYMPISREDS